MAIADVSTVFSLTCNAGKLEGLSFGAYANSNFLPLKFAAIMHKSIAIFPMEVLLV